MHDDLSRYYLTLIFPEPRNIKSLRPKRHFLFYPTQDFRISSAPAIFFLQDKTSEVTVPKLSSPDYYSDRFRRDFGSRNLISACNLFFTRQDFRSHRPVPTASRCGSFQASITIQLVFEGTSEVGISSAPKVLYSKIKLRLLKPLQ